MNWFKKIAEDISSDENLLPSNFKPEYGSCMLAAELLTKLLLQKGISDFKIIEGYITFEGVDWDEAHTWIELNNGKILDPTQKQWSIENIVYLNNRRKEYSPQKYLELCDKYPEQNTERFLGQNSMSWSKQIISSSEKTTYLHLMENLLQEGITDWNTIVQELLKSGIDRQLLGWLHQKYINIYGLSFG